MALTVSVNDLQVIQSCDALDASRNNIGTGVNSPNATDTEITAEGTASWRARVTGTGLGGVEDDFGSGINLDHRHIFIWCRSLDNVSAAGQGWRLRWDDSASAGTVYHEINVGDQNTSRNVFNGFFNFCADPISANMQNGGAGVQSIALARSFGILADHVTASSRDTMFFDEYKVMSGITVTGGASAPRGSIEVAAADATAGRGTFVDINGVYYILGNIVIGDVTAATNSTYEDTNKVWVFQDGAISAGFHRLSFVGGTGTNAATIGTLVGTGVTAVGVSGNSFLAAGLVPFHVIAEDADIAVAIYGSSLLCPAARMTDTFRRTFNANAVPTFLEYTMTAAKAIAGSGTIQQPAAVNFAKYSGYSLPFDNHTINITTAHNGTFTVVLEYWNGAWVEFNNVDMGGLDFQSTGVKTVTWEIPDDWVTTTVSTSGSFYFIRYRVDAVTTAGTVQAIGGAETCDIGGRINLEQNNADIISGSITNFETCKLRGSALFRKNNVIGSTASTKAGAVNMGAVNPANNWRDLAIQNGTNGIHLIPTGTGSTTYDFRNITFAGNTFDVLNSGIATVVDNVAITAQDASTPLNDTVHGVGHSFAGAAQTLSRVQFMLSKTLTPTGNATAKVYAHSGSKGTTSVPTGAALATSQVVDVSTLTGTLTMTDFEFRDEFVMSAATDYVVTIEYTGGTAANIVNVGTDATAPAHAGNLSTATTLFVWSAVAGTDAVFEVRSGAIAVINVLESGDTPTVSTLSDISGATVVNASVTVSLAGVTEGTPVKFIANETVGTIVTGDVLNESLADVNGEVSFGINYEGAFNPSGLDVIVRARNAGVAVAAIADDGGVFTDETLFALNSQTNNMTLLPAVPVVDDAYYFGHTEEFPRLKLDISTAIAGTGNTIVWEYFNGTVWVELIITDGTVGLTVTGKQIVAWGTIPDWATTTINTQGPFFYIRARLSATTTITTVPVASTVTLDVTKYLPYVANRVIASTGLADNAAWTVDGISQFSADQIPVFVVAPVPQSVINANGKVPSASGTTVSDTFTLAAGTDRKLIVMLQKFLTADTATQSWSATYDGNAMTLIASDAPTTTSETTSFYYDIPDVDSGSKTIDGVWSQTITNKALIWCVIDNSKSGAVDANDISTDRPSATFFDTTLTNVGADAMLVHIVMNQGSLRTWDAVGAGDTEELNLVNPPDFSTDIHIVSDLVTTVAAETVRSTASGLTGCDSIGVFVANVNQRP